MEVPAGSAREEMLTCGACPRTDRVERSEV